MNGLLPRDVWVWTPPGYHIDEEDRYPVIYMHDGQNLFDPEKSYTHVTWGVAEAITKLSGWGFIRPAIVVGIDNTENRIGDYLPTKPFDTPAGEATYEKYKLEAPDEFNKINFVADIYLQMIVEKIKPLIDGNFRTLNDMKNTLIMGSSMGGLISLYALVEYPHTFGAAGCFSTHWPIVNDLIIPYLGINLPKVGHHKIYFDRGTEGYDAQYEPYQQAVDALMEEKGYVHGRDWLSRLAPGADHHEQAWRSRIHLALRFFL
jgi:predicted alpha/beta superfamily hydrolase